MKTALRKMILFTALIAALTGCSKKDEAVVAPLTIASATAQATGTWKATQFSVVNNGTTTNFTPTKGETLQFTNTNVKLYSSSGYNSLFNYTIGTNAGSIDAFDLTYTIELPTTAMKESVLGTKYKTALGTDNYFALIPSNSDGYMVAINGTKMSFFIPLLQMTIQFEKQ